MDANNGGGLGVTETDGHYEVSVAGGWSGTVTPAKKYYTFDPNETSYTVVLADQTNQNYTADNIYDLDCDGVIDWGDMVVIADYWLAQGTAILCDFNADEIVSFPDFAQFGNAWQDK
jgi:hypothetical protein